MYTYRVTAVWPDGSRYERNIVFRGGEQVHLVLTPSKASSGDANANLSGRAPDSHDQPQHGGAAPPRSEELLNFGLEVQRLKERSGRPSGQERFLWQGREISRAEALALLGGQMPDTSLAAKPNLPDDSQSPHLTIVSRDTSLRQRIVRDLETAPELVEWRRRFRIQSYPADHWIVPRLGLDKDKEFAATGLAIVVQEPAGEEGTSPARICYRYEGPGAFARWLRQEPAPRLEPRFPSKWLYLALFAAALWLIWRTRSL
ncbi:MAG: hypothetical protein NZM42_07825 [Gemmatales bacterium]|nr:hypothetical protein [Gemmatales bacterium]